MLETFNATLTPMLVMFTCILIGYVLNRKKLTPEQTPTVLSRLETYVLVPAVMINTFLRYCTPESLAEHSGLIVYSGLAVVMAVGIACVLCRLFTRDAYQQTIYRYALTFGNFGFLGNAIVPVILGEEALYRYLLFCLPVYLVAYTWGVISMIPKEKRGGIIKFFVNPTFISILIGGGLGLLRLGPKVPDFVMTTVGNLASCMGPVAMVLTGYVIGNYKIPDLLKKGRIYAATLLRLFILPALFVAVLVPLGAGREALMFVLFVFATPLGLNTVVYPAAYGADTSTGASMAMISHTLGVLTIPVMCALLTLIA